VKKCLKKEKKKLELNDGGCSDTPLRILLFEVLTASFKSPCWVPVIHFCNPSYTGGRDQED
jgi:hypothetical protein